MTLSEPLKPDSKTPIFENRASPTVSSSVQKTANSVDKISISSLHLKPLTQGKDKKIWVVNSDTLKHVPEASRQKWQSVVFIEPLLANRYKAVVEEFSLMNEILTELGTDAETETNLALEYTKTRSTDNKEYYVMQKGISNAEHAIRNCELAFETRISYCQQTLKGMSNLHSTDRVHGDLKPENLLIFENDVLRIADFGKSTIVQEELPTNKQHYKGNTRFGPPEGYLSKAGDVYGTALVLVRILEEQLLNDSKTSLNDPLKSTKSPPADSSRRGVEKYILDNPVFGRSYETKDSMLGKARDLTARAKTVSGLAGNLDQETQALGAYIDKLCNDLVNSGHLEQSKSKDLKNLLTSMTNKDPLSRPSMEEVASKFDSIFKTAQSDRESDSLSASSSTQEERSSLKAYTHASSLFKLFLGSKAIGFEAFNLEAGRLKSNPYWKESVIEEVKNLSPRALKNFASLTPFNLRGFDPEVMLFIMGKVKENIENKGLQNRVQTVLPQLESTIKHLESTVIRHDVSVELLDEGKVNKVYTVILSEVDPVTKKEVQTESVFKPDTPTGSRLTENLWGTAAGSGIPKGKAAHLNSRAIASSAVDRLLFGENPVSVRTRLACINGQQGILMDKAKGTSPVVLGETKRVVSLDNEPDIREMLELSDDDPQILSIIAASLELNPQNLQIVDNKGQKTLTYTEKVFEAFSPQNPTTIEDQLKLQVLDWICGQVDRHNGNYFIDPSGKVTAIDQDCSFGVLAVPEGVDVRSQPKLGFIVPNMGSLMLRMPSVVTEKVRDNITALFNNSDNLVAVLEPYITQEEISATLKRLNTLYTHVQSDYRPTTDSTPSSGCLKVQTKEELLTLAKKSISTPEFTGLVDADNSYWGREVLKLRANETNNNYLR